MKLTTDILPNYFTIASEKNSHYLIPTNTFDFVDKNSKQLLVTVGDSWTWGADLPEKTRLSDLYGNIISDNLGTDWLNLGQSGSNNFFIAERVEEFGKLVNRLCYDKIYLICTFTESGRSFNSHYDVYIDYVNWFKNNSIYNFLEFLNQECVNRIQQVANEYNLILKIGTNFVDPIGITNVLPTPWFRLLGIECPIIAHAGTTGVKRLADVKFFTNQQSEYMHWFGHMVDSAAYIDRVSHDPILINAHPGPSGHSAWANYLLSNI